MIAGPLQSLVAVFRRLLVANCMHRCTQSRARGICYGSITSSSMCMPHTINSACVTANFTQRLQSQYLLIEH